jgi:hypothetical protein
MSYPGLIVKTYGTASDCMGFEEKAKKIKEDENSKTRKTDSDFHF